MMAFVENIKFHLKTEQHKETLIRVEWANVWKATVKYLERGDDFDEMTKRKKYNASEKC